MKTIFHQYVHIEKGPINSILVDFLRDKIYHVDNKTLKLFEKGIYSKIPSFMNFIRKKDLTIDIKKEAWIPYIELKTRIEPPGRLPIEIEIEDKSFFELARNTFRSFDIKKIRYVENLQNLFRNCNIKSKINGSFEVDLDAYRFNMKFNSCWGQKIAISKEGKIKPCINSKIIIGDFFKDCLSTYIDEVNKYWRINKDKVEQCKICEFRYCCFDCREIAILSGKRLYSKNPNCCYNLNNGTWDL